jgi:hypothetical protein
VFADLEGPMRHAEPLESALAAVQPGTAVRYHVHLGAGGGVLDQVFLGTAVRAVTHADVFPVGGEAFVLRETRASGQRGQQRERREDP